jgi:cytochrome c oxidase subunit 2
MNSIIRVVSQEDYEKWLAKVPVKKLDNSLGLKVLEKNGCIACHSTNGTKLVGPSFKGLYGATIEVTTNGANRKVTVDSVYIESSIYDPNKDVAVGYPQGVMKSYKGIIKAKDIQLMTEYLKSLK